MFIRATEQTGERSLRLLVASSLAGMLFLTPGAPAEPRSHLAGPGVVPAMVRRVLPAIVSITTRQIETNQFNQAVPTRGLGSGFIVDRRGYRRRNHEVPVLRIGRQWRR